MASIIVVLRTRILERLPRLVTRRDLGHFSGLPERTKGAPEMARTDTLVHRLANWANKTPDRPAIRGKTDGVWVTHTWREYWQAVRETARGILALGHKEGECVAIVGDNSCEWVIAQFGIMAARGIPAPIYTTN